MRKQSIECWIYNKDLKKFLLLEVKTQDLQFWQPITGGIEQDETPEEAAIREIWEETGLKINRQSIFELGTQIVPINETLIIEKTLFLTSVVEDEVRISNEHVDWRWEDCQRIHDFLYWENNKSSFKLAVEFVGGKFKHSYQEE